MPEDDLVGPVLSFVADRRGIDFRDHRRASTSRAIRARLRATGTPDGNAYLARLDADPGELDSLLAALVVPVSSFFRDARVFAALERAVLPDLLAGGQPLRAWVPGVATGPEAWSLAMLLADSAGAEIVASDVDGRALEIAARGRYPADMRLDVPARFRHWLCDDASDVVVAERLRRHLRFCQHDLMGPRLAPAAAVLASFHLISLRNVLIYFDRRLQNRAVERLRAVLVPGGVLVLGMVESLPSALEATFEVYPGLDPGLRIFRRVD